MFVKMKAIQEERKKKIKWSERAVVEHNNGIEVSESVDCVDALPENLSFTVIDIIVLLISITSYLFDTGTDIYVAYILYHTGHLGYFGVTVSLILIPAIVMAGFSLKWYITDNKLSEGTEIQKIVTLCWVLKIICVCFHLGPVIRYMSSLYYGIMFRKSKKFKVYYLLMVCEDADAALLRLFECFMEAGPQLILQIYILAVETAYFEGHWVIVTAQAFSILSSLFSMAWSLVSYHRSLRISLSGKENMSTTGSFTQLLWHIFTLSSRVLALALFASLYPYLFAVFCTVHWGVMALWIITMKTEFCENKCGELIYNAVLGVIYIFCYFNAVDSPTKFRYTIYYTIYFVENTIFILIWYFMCNPLLWYRHAALAGQVISFFIGMVFMVTYYLLLHPSGTVAVKICSSTDHCSTAHKFAEDGTCSGHQSSNQRLGRLDEVDVAKQSETLCQPEDSLISNCDETELNGTTKKPSIETAV